MDPQVSALQTVVLALLVCVGVLTLAIGALVAALWPRAKKSSVKDRTFPRAAEQPLWKIGRAQPEEEDLFRTKHRGHELVLSDSEFEGSVVTTLRCLDCAKIK